MSNLQWKVITILVVFIAFSAVGIYPLVAARYGINQPKVLMDKILKRGLDLQGGVHLVLRVQTDTALASETNAEVERLRDLLKTRNVPFSSLTATNATEFKIEGIPSEQDSAFREAAADLETNYARSPGANGSYTFALRPNVAIQMREQSVIQARQTIERRVNELGVAEPTIVPQNNDQIVVELPGVTDIAQAKSIIQAEGVLELKLVEQGPASTREALLPSGQVPDGMEVIQGSAGSGETGSAFYLVRKAAVVRGRDLRTARQSLDQNNRPAVSFELNPEGARKFSDATGANIGRYLAIVLDNRIISAPRIDGRIGAQGQIFGNFTTQSAQDLALVLRSGALPAKLDYLQEQTIGASLGVDSIRKGMIASLVGLMSIIVFMLIYYKLSGVNAVVALVFNLVILLGLMAYIGAVMTLPGIAGFVLTMGIGVDSNVLIFERIKEELEAQRGVRASINAGFGRVFWTLFDTHIAALISVAFLFQFGTGPIRGFAVTLFFGLMSNLFTSIFVSKTLYEMVLSGRQQVQTLSI